MHAGPTNARRAFDLPDLHYEGPIDVFALAKKLAPNLNVPPYQRFTLLYGPRRSQRTVLAIDIANRLNDKGGTIPGSRWLAGYISYMHQW